MSDLNTLKHFVRINGKILGPFGLEQLRSLKSRGRLHADYEVSLDRRTWLPASSLVDLFGQPAATKQSFSPVDVAEAEPSAKPIEWFYTNGDEQRGPLPFKQIKTLAAQGELTPSDLIWHSGLDDWIPAGDQPGLFAAHRSSSLQKNSGTMVHDSNHAQSQTYIWSLVLEVLREHFTARQLQQFVISLSSAGGFSLTLACLFSLVFFVTLSIKMDSVQFMFFGLGTMLVTSALKYVGMHSLQAGDALIRTTPNQMSSPAAVNMASVVLLSLGILLFSGLLNLGIHENRFEYKIGLFVVAGEILFVLGMAACFLLQTGWMNVEIVSNSRAGQEGIAVLSFVSKLFVRVSAFTFAVSSVLSAAGFGIAGLMTIFTEDLTKSIDDIYALSRAAIIHVLVAGLLPLFFYLLFITGSIFLDTCQSILNSDSALAGPSTGRSRGTGLGGSYDD